MLNPHEEALLALEAAERAATSRAEKALLAGAWIDVTLALRAHEETPPPPVPVGTGGGGVTVLGSDQV